MKTLKPLTPAILVLMAAVAQADMAISVQDAWIRYIPGDRPMAGYFVVANKGDTHRRLTGASSPAFGMAHVHRTVERDGMATMEPVEDVMVPALNQVEFAPGGYHLMLMRPQQPLQVGDEVPITLRFRDGGSQAAVFTIKPTWQE